jgi:hypothetical protein
MQRKPKSQISIEIRRVKTRGIRTKLPDGPYETAHPVVEDALYVFKNEIIILRRCNRRFNFIIRVELVILHDSSQDPKGT